MEYYDYPYEEIIWYKIEDYNEFLLELSNYFDIKYTGNIDMADFKMSIKNICQSYKNLLSIYNKITNPIDFNEMLQAIENVHIALFTYENPNSDLQIAKTIALKKLQNSLEFQLKTYNNSNGKSFMFTLSNNAFHNKF